MITFDIPFGIDFFQNLQKHKFNLKTNTVDMLFASKKPHFPIITSLFVYVFSKPLPGTVFRGSKCRSFIKSLIWVPFSIFEVFQKRTFGMTCSFKVVSTSPSASRAGRPCRDPASHETKIITVPLGFNGF